MILDGVVSVVSMLLLLFCGAIIRPAAAAWAPAAGTVASAGGVVHPRHQERVLSVSSTYLLWPVVCSLALVRTSAPC